MPTTNASAVRGCRSKAVPQALMSAPVSGSSAVLRLPMRCRGEDPLVQREPGKTAIGAAEIDGHNVRHGGLLLGLPWQPRSIKEVCQLMRAGDKRVECPPDGGGWASQTGGHPVTILECPQKEGPVAG